ncbi:uncharacterized protein CCOS01_10581, partial [Colletotrichum costaricense]
SKNDDASCTYLITTSRGDKRYLEGSEPSYLTLGNEGKHGVYLIKRRSIKYWSIDVVCDSVRPVYFSTKQQCLCAKRWPLSVCPVYFASPSTTSRIIGNATLAPNLGYSSYTPHSPGPIAGPRGRYRDGDDSNDMTRSARHWPSITNAPGVCPPRYPSGFCLSST